MRPEITIAVFALGLWSTAAAGQARERVDLLLVGGPVITEDPGGTIARAIAIRDGRIVAVGGADLARRYQASQVVNLAGRAVIPGFFDTHIHVSGDPPWYVDLSEVRSVAEIKRLVHAKAVALGPGHWITGYGWSEDQLVEKRKPLRGDLDQAAPDNPVVIDRAGGHSGVANSKALALAGLTRDSKDPEGGVIERGPDGQLTGVIRERQDTVSRLAPEATAEQLRPSLVAKLRGLFSLGITSIIEASTALGDYPEWERVYREHRGQLPRAAVQIRWAGEERMRAFGRKTGDGDEWLRLGAVKLFVDGGFTGPAAYTLAPYRGQGDYRGKLVYGRDELFGILQSAHRLGWQLGLHTIGDGAIALAVELLDSVLRVDPRADHRHYLNHFSMRPPEATLETMARDRIAIAQQPNFTFTLEGRYRANLEGERLEHNNPLRTPLRHGLVLALGSDILPIGPILGLYAATTRRGMSGQVYGPDERLSIDEALAGYTRVGTYLTREEAIKGTLEPGKVADLVVLSEDPRQTPPDRLRRLRVELTVLGGRMVYQRKLQRRGG